MSSIFLRSRIISNNCSSKIINRRVLSSGVVSSSSNPSKETIIASQSILSDQSPPPPPPPAPEVSPQASGRKSWSFLKYGLIAAVTGAIGYAGYLSYSKSFFRFNQDWSFVIQFLFLFKMWVLYVIKMFNFFFFKKKINLICRVFIRGSRPEGKGIAGCSELYS